MIVGVPREVKNKEKRVALTPSGVTMLTDAGHDVLIEKTAGNGSGFLDAEYEAAGAEMLSQKELIRMVDS